MCFVLGPLEQHGYRHEFVNSIVNNYEDIIDLLWEESQRFCGCSNIVVLVSSKVPIMCCAIQINKLQWNCLSRDVLIACFFGLLTWNSYWSTILKTFKKFLFLLITIISHRIVKLVMERIYLSRLAMAVFHTDWSVEREDICVRSGNVSSTYFEEGSELQ